MRRTLERGVRSGDFERAGVWVGVIRWPASQAMRVSLALNMGGGFGLDRSCWLKCLREFSAGELRARAVSVSDCSKTCRLPFGNPAKSDAPKFQRRLTPVGFAASAHAECAFIVWVSKKLAASVRLQRGEGRLLPSETIAHGFYTVNKIFECLNHSCCNKLLRRFLNS